MSSRASATLLLILLTLALTRFFELQFFLLQSHPQIQSSKGTLLLAFILARHFPVSMLLILIDPAESHNLHVH